MSDVKNTRKIRGKMSNTTSITSASLADIVAESLRKSWGQFRSSAKMLARAIDTNERTASNLLEGKHAPGGATLIKLMAQDDEVFAAVLALAGRDPPPSHQQIQAIKEALRIMEGR